MPNKIVSLQSDLLYLLVSSNSFTENGLTKIQNPVSGSSECENKMTKHEAGLSGGRRSGPLHTTNQLSVLLDVSYQLCQSYYHASNKLFSIMSGFQYGATLLGIRST